MTKKMDREHKIAVVLDKNPQEYAGILDNTEREKGNNLTIKRPENSMEKNTASNMTMQK